MAGQLFEGKNLDEAVERAAAGLGVERFRIAYHIVSEKRGFLGGSKRVVIEAGMRPFDEMPEENMPPVMPVSSNPFDPGRSPRAGGRGRGNSRGRGDRQERGGRAPRERGNPQYSGERRRERQPLTRNPNESDFAYEVRSWCDKLFDQSNLNLAATVEELEGEIRVMLSGADTKKLIHRDGELLDSIQVIANKTRLARDGKQRIEFDCEGFKEKRSHDLEQQALSLADIVRRDGGEQMLPAMSPIERRIVHLALQNDADVTTESRGEGFFKRVAIFRRPAAPVTTEEPTES